MLEVHENSQALSPAEKKKLREIEALRKRRRRNNIQRRDRIAYNAKLKNHGLRVERDRLMDFLERQPIAVLRHACEEVRIFSLSIKKP